jgi:hypothetical protein
MTILEKLNIIQTTLKAPKDKYNQFGEFWYRSCEGIIEGVKPLLAEHKLVLLLKDDMVEIGGRVYVKATATLKNCENESGGEIENTAFAREAETKSKMDASQITGTASSYARKYALNGLFLIDDTKDADTDEYAKMQQNKEDSKPDIKKLTAQHLNVIKKACANAKFDGDAEVFWRNRYHVETLADIPDADFDFMLTSMKCDRYGNYKG